MTEEKKPKSESKQDKDSEIDKSTLNLEKMGLITVNAGLEMTKAFTDIYTKSGLGMLNIAQEQLRPFTTAAQPIMDFNKQIQDQMKPILQLYQPIIDLNKVAQEQLKSFTAIAQPIIDFNTQIQDQMKPILQSFQPMIDLNKVAQEQMKPFTQMIQSSAVQNLNLNIPASSLINLTSFSDSILKGFNQNILSLANNFYPTEQLTPLENPPTIPKSSRANELSTKLTNCESGNEHWSDYEDICKEILQYCLVPPLMEPMEQSETRDKLHRRDLIFHIPHGLTGFWNYMLTIYGMAIIVECKNYGNALKENEVFITTKYFHPKKLGSFGLILTRVGLHENGIKTQENTWKEDGKMMICLNDNDLIKMLELKNNDDEPWKVIDSAIRHFRQSL